MPWGSEEFGAGPWGDGVVGSFFLVSGETIRENMSFKPPRDLIELAMAK